MLTKKQFDLLAPYEQYFTTAVRSDWARNPGRDALTLIHGVMTEAAGYRTPLQSVLGCARCQLRLLKDAGEAWFEAKERLERRSVSSKDIKPTRRAIKANRE